MTYFKVEDISPLERGRSLNIHMIGICGSAMGQLALAFDRMGHRVSGSDNEFYEPMASALSNSSITLLNGYCSENIKSDTDIVVIGNSIRKDNPELEAVREYKLAYTCLPAVVSDILVKDRRPLVVSGTHGKSTTSAILAHSLEVMGRNPGYLVGADVPTLKGSFEVGSGQVTVLEGDEYDSAFFAKVPKFAFYDPSILVITSIEFDHADIYPDLDGVVAEFSKLVLSRSAGNHIICCSDDDVIAKMLPRWRHDCQASFITYGFKEGADWRIQDCQTSGNRTAFKLLTRTGDVHSCSVPLIGDHNALNVTAALIALSIVEEPVERVVESLQNFRGVTRRLNLIIDKQGKKIFEDFAHHPSAVKATLKALRASLAPRRLFAVFEPRSNTSRRKVFQQLYADALLEADLSIVKAVTFRDGDSAENLLDTKALVADIRERGREAISVVDNQEIVQCLAEQLEQDDVAVVMSNGSFGGLIKHLTNSFG